MAPNKHSYLVKAGNLLRELHRHEEAIVCFEQAIDIEPDQAEAYAHMAISMAKLGHLDAAFGCCKIALEIDPTPSVAHYHSALLEIRQDEKQGALRSLNAAIELSLITILIFQRTYQWISQCESDDHNK